MIDRVRTHSHGKRVTANPQIRRQFTLANQACNFLFTMALKVISGQKPCFVRLQDFMSVANTSIANILIRNFREPLYQYPQKPKIVAEEWIYNQ